MDANDIKRIVYNHLKDDYYTKLRALESDIEFFTLYMKRNQKSEFRFDLRVSQGMSYKAFDHIWKKYGWYKDELETAFAEYILLKMVITNIYEETNIFTEAEIKAFIDYFEKCGETIINDYISDFVGCSMGCKKIEERINNIKAQ